MSSAAGVARTTEITNNPGNSYCPACSATPLGDANSVMLTADEIARCNHDNVKRAYNTDGSDLAAEYRATHWDTDAEALIAVLDVLHKSDIMNGEGTILVNGSRVDTSKEQSRRTRLDQAHKIKISTKQTTQNQPKPLMDKKLLKLAVKHADKLDPTILQSVSKATGYKVPGGSKPPKTGATAASCHPAPSAPTYDAPNQTQYASSCPPRPPSLTSSSPFAPIAPQYATTQPTELSVKEKTMSFTGDDAKVKDSNGNTLFKIHAELLTLSQRRKVIDSYGNVIGQLRHKKMDIAPTIYIGTPDNEKKVAVKTTGMFNPLKCNASIYVDGAKVGKISGNWRAKKFTVRINDVVIANIGRKRTMASTFMDADSYVISVCPQGHAVDLAFVALLTIALDELYHDKE